MTYCHLKIRGNPFCFSGEKDIPGFEAVPSVCGDILHALPPSETFRKQPAECFQFSEDYASLRRFFPCLRKL